MAKKKSSQDTKLRGFGTQQLTAKLKRAEALASQKKWRQALELLEAIDQQYPDQPEVLKLLASIYHHLHNHSQYQLLYERLHQLQPDNPDLLMALAVAYLQNSFPILAYNTVKQLLDRWPSHADAKPAQELLAQLNTFKPTLLEDLTGSEAERLSLATLRELGQSLLQQGNYDAARQTLRELLDRKPDYIPAFNNLSLVEFAARNNEAAIATAEQALALDPENVHALANLVRFHLMSAHVETAQSLGERLKTIQATNSDLWLKQAEAFAFLGDDQATWNLMQTAHPAMLEDPATMNSMLLHLGAVAAFRLGYDQQARQFWQQAIAHNPGLQEAQANLNDLLQPISQRHAPWALGASYWISKPTIDKLVTWTRDKADDALREAIQAFLQQHPEITALIPILLDRGDPQGRQFAFMVANQARTPEMLAALKEFALSQRGPDTLRQQAAQVATEAGLMATGPVKLWLEGEWREVLLMGFEVHGDPVWTHAPRVERLLREATTALKQGQAIAAENLFQQALALEPQAPDLLYNLTNAYKLQNRDAEALVILEQLHQQRPDYLFASVELARRHIQQGELEQAEALLQPLLSRKRLHFSELATLCEGQIELALAREKPDAAHSWLGLWEMATPNHPQLIAWRRWLERLHPRQPRPRGKVWQAP